MISYLDNDFLALAQKSQHPIVKKSVDCDFSALTKVATGGIKSQPVLKGDRVKTDHYDRSDFVHVHVAGDILFLCSDFTQCRTFLLH